MQTQTLYAQQRRFAHARLAGLLDFEVFLHWRRENGANDFPQ